ncbi:MAG: acyl-phosphate glycerol 3-phosphate acyltransferase [Firmicutes bacterium HGW-Firmicutes-12]|nr:MAG: acyl-phosphate glycerol 3-phosphate acyltransferase [Firmicutes bacterium HGW-Firmicutes-12]
MLELVLIIFFSYLVGSISFGIISGKLLNGIDIRKHGSGNAGVTNVLRILGKGPAIAVLFGDTLKGAVGVLIGLYFGDVIYGMAGGMAVVVGHIYPLYFGFKGGKGSATGFGVMLMLAPDVISIGALIFVLTIITTRYVSLGSILGAIISVVMVFILHKPLPIQIFLLLMASFVIFQHRSNILRLYQGKENKISLGSK